MNSWLNQIEQGKGNSTRLDPASAKFATEYLQNYVGDGKVDIETFAKEVLGDNKELPESLKAKFEQHKIITLDDCKAELKKIVPVEKLSEFEPIISNILKDFDNKIINKAIDGLSEMDKKAEIHKDKKGNIIYDKESKDTEIVKFEEDINTYMAREVLPHVPDAKAFFEGKSETATWDEDNGEKTIKIGAEIPFTRYFYEYKEPTPSEELLAKFQELEKQVREKINGLF